MRKTMSIAALGAAALALGVGSAWAGGCNLYPSASQTCSFNGAQYDVVAPHPTGTGYIDSFLRVQQNGTEQGYNTSGRPVQFDEKKDLTFTHDLLTADVPVVTNPNGLIGNYRQFFLDINEQAQYPDAYLTLDQLKIFVSNTPSITKTATDAGYTSSGTLTGATQVYSMDTATKDNWVNLDYNLIGGGSGSGDMVVYIPDSALFQNDQYVYLYSQFGCVPDKKGVCGTGANTKYASGAGFEEWWTLSPVQPPSPVPEPTTLLLVGGGLLAGVRRFRLM